MRVLIVLSISLLAVGCTSRVILSTHYPDAKEYDLLFGWMLMIDVQGGELTQEEREGEYEAILNRVLKADEATKTCTVVKNSFQYYEPGCCASARVACQEKVTFDAPKKIYNSEGVPLFSYKVRNE